MIFLKKNFNSHLCLLANLGFASAIEVFKHFRNINFFQHKFAFKIISRTEPVTHCPHTQNFDEIKI